MTFSGSGFSGDWPNNDHARLVVQLNGPIDIGDYTHCITFRVDGQEVSKACGNGFESYEFAPGGYTVVMGFQSPLNLETNDIVEISFVLGTTFGEGEKTDPKLVYGGEFPHRISFIEIGGGT